MKCHICKSTVFVHGSIDHSFYDCKCCLAKIQISHNKIKIVRYDHALYSIIICLEINKYYYNWRLKSDLDWQPPYCVRKKLDINLFKNLKDKINKLVIFI